MQRPSLPVKVVGDFLLSLNTLAVGGARFSDAKLNGCRRMASVFIANRLKSSSLLHDERISGSCQRHLPIVMRRSATFVGHRKIKPRTARSKGSKPRGKKLNSNISKNETLRHLSDSCLRSTLHRQR